MSFLLAPAMSPSSPDLPPPEDLLPPPFPAAAATPLPYPTPIIINPTTPPAPLLSLPSSPHAPSPELLMAEPPLPLAFPPSAHEKPPPTPPVPTSAAQPTASVTIPSIPEDSPPPEAPSPNTATTTTTPLSPRGKKPVLPRIEPSPNPLPPAEPWKRHHSAPLLATPSAPAGPQIKPLPTDPLSPPSSLTPPETPTTVFPSTATATSPSSDEPFFPEMSLPPPAAQNSPPSSPGLLNGSMPVTAVSGQTSGRVTTGASEVRPSAGLIAGLSVGGGLALVIFGLLWLFICRRGKGKRVKSDHEKDLQGTRHSGIKGDECNAVHSNNNNVPPPKSHSITMPLDPAASGSALLLSFSSGSFTYDELVHATGDFSGSNLLGEGGFGYVHKGVLPSGKEIAVKQLKIGSHQGEREFRAELETISRVHHKHLVTLIGYCITGSARFLIYEFVPNKTLEFHLHGDGQPVMDWATRLRIAIGSAKGLAYLHEDCSPTIIHRDIKAANILLDFKFEAKVSDFGLAKFFSDTSSSHLTHISTRVVGTFGYLAPEYASSGKLTEKSDVYSYGIMLLELISGRTPIRRIEPMVNEALVDWARPLLGRAMEAGELDQIVDPRLEDNYDINQMTRVIECAAACIRHSARLRPRMSQIVRAMEENEPLTDHEEGCTPPHSRLYSSLDIKRLTMALTSPDYGPSQRSDSTSEYGLYPSRSGSEAYLTR
ncbi:hypothetical protein SAY87_019133 [Trapa incisa]|uniref:non-specific serine/threonine protein kinase n=1 Tax=Trapa incisa TaxID=236973 RepID=A0AAN7Q185_9MYRT|nr:hypothetical protein SAY87_019133 [Trapa incisa]